MNTTKCSYEGEIGLQEIHGGLMRKSAVLTLDLKKELLATALTGMMMVVVAMILTIIS